jgi:hypothetical protein
MKTRPDRRTALILVVATVAGVVGCASAKAPSADPPRKEYPWKDLSDGGGLYRPRPTPPSE